jgi:hypothetical protein
MEGEMSSIATKYQLRTGSVAAMLRDTMLVFAVLVGVAYAPQASAQGTTPAAETAPLSQEQLEQLVAPIALYPDDLLSQVLMASTYPLEVVQAARWASQNPGMTGKALEDGMAKQKWDPSVKGLVAVPQTLQMMSDKLDWTQQLGDAFLDDQAAVLDAVQRLRQRAEGAGNLKTSPQMRVSKVSMPNPTGQPVERIVVERADPQTVYVPVYDPGVAYGTWPYPDYPPYYYQPPGWVPGTFAYGAVGFGVGAVVGAAIWGGANWWGGNVNINANRYNSFNRTNIANGNWNHNVNHRGNVPYRNNATAQRFGGQTGQGRAQAGQRGRQGAGAGTGNRQTGAGKAGAGQKGGGQRKAGAGQKGGGQSKAAQNRKGGGQRAAKQGGGNRQANRASQGAARSGNVSRGGGGMQHRGGGGMQHRAAGGMNRSMGGARGGGGMRAGGGGGGGRGGGRRSDIRVKHDIALLGHLDNGLGFYRFSYNGSNKAYVGVMAQEVRAIRPAVVTRDRDGMLRVRYDMLGVKFQTYDRWIQSGARIPVTVRAY